MAITVNQVLSRVSQVLQDTDNIRWPVSASGNIPAELVDWLNDGCREVVMYKPDANSIDENLALVAGTKQMLPADAIRLLDVPRNMGSGGTTPGRSIRFIKRKVLDDQNPNWHTMTASASIIHYTVNENSPKDLAANRLTFYVYPPAAVPTYVEIVYLKTPALAVAGNAALPINEIYANAVINYILFRALSKDAEYTANPAQAAAYYQLFANEMGIAVNNDKEADAKN